MSGWVVAFFVLALLAAFAGFSGVAEEGEFFGKLVFVVAFALTLLSLAVGLRMKRPIIVESAKAAA